MKVAVIDIGSNSVRLMMWANGTLYKRVNTTRLGERVAETGCLQEVAIERTVSAITTYVKEAERNGADRIYVFATAAVRESRNRAEFCRRVRLSCGVDVDVVSGETEASLGLNGALGKCENGGIIDIGGASTEICFKRSGTIVFSTSMPIGAVRLLNRCGQDRARLEREIDTCLSSLSVVAHERVFAIGGTATTLACLKLALADYDAKKIHGCELSITEMQSFVDLLFSCSIEQRKNLVGMDVRRADVISGAALLLFRVMEKLRIDTVTVSDADNLEGYLWHKGIV